MGLLSALFGGGDKTTQQSTATTNTTNQFDNRNVLGNGATQVGAYGSLATNSNNRTTNSFDIRDSSSHLSNSNNTSSLSFLDDSSHFSNSNNTSNTTSSLSFSDASSRYANSGNTSNLSFSDDSRHNSGNTSSYSFTGTDGGAVNIARFNSQLLQAVGENQGDTVRLLAQMGADGISKQSAAATNLFTTGSAEAGKAWGHTVDKAGAVLEGLMNGQRIAGQQNASTWGSTLDAASSVVERMLGSAQATITGAQTVARDANAASQPSDSKNTDTLRYALFAGAALAAVMLFRKG